MGIKPAAAEFQHLFIFGFGNRRSAAAPSRHDNESITGLFFFPLHTDDGHDHRQKSG